MKKKRNIIYLCHAEKGPSGGAKVTYHHSEIVNTFKNTSSQVIHLQKKKLSKWRNSLNKKLGIKRKYSGWLIQDVEVKKNFKFPWFDSKIKISNSLNFSNNDFIILPDIFAHLAKELCIKKKINYAIFAQNGYALESTNNHKILNEVYKKAEFILTYSDHMIESVLNLFPFCKKKIIKLKMRIEASLKNNILKKNIITYMPRKLPGHSSKLIFFLKNKLPKNWKILPLHNMSQNEVYNNLMKSKIFLSFSYFDSLGLPPLEAALLGNKVIGYTGEGGKEYWKKPIFTEIYSGELFKFVDEILKEIKNKSFLKKSRKFRNKLKKNYSKDEEIKYLKKFVYKICQ